MKKHNLNRGWAVLPSLAAVFSILAACQGKVAQNVSRSPIPIGVVAPFFTTPGEGIRHGVAMAVGEINVAGGVLGRTFEVVEVNDEFSPSKATLAYQSLAGRDRVVAVIGFAGSDVFPVMEQLSRYGVPVLGTGVAADRLTEMVRQDPARYGRFFRVMHRSSELAGVTSEFLRDFLFGELGLKRFAILVEDDIWTKYLRDEWKKTIQANPGMSLVFEDTFSPQTTDFGATFRQIQRANADYVLDASSRVPSALYLKRWAETKGPLIGAVPTGAGTRKYYEEVGAAGTGVCTVGVIPSENNPLSSAAAAWHRAYTARYGDPEYTSAYSYDAVYLLRQAIASAASIDVARVAAALEKTDAVGVMGRYRFEPDHHPKFGSGFRTINMLQYQYPEPDGYRVIWPKQRAAAHFVPPSWWRARVAVVRR
ncbi:MAG TPA: ABC transporter substrate-binding protein [Thermoanaerobaculia bacterium]|nr:ABC transporter substrate-binding protein [Thermoanaerobaculia bacterium]